MRHYITILSGMAILLTSSVEWVFWNVISCFSFLYVIGGDGGGPDGGGHVLLYGGHGPDNRAVSDDVWLLEL